MNKLDRQVLAGSVVVAGLGRSRQAIGATTTLEKKKRREKKGRKKKNIRHKERLIHRDLIARKSNFQNGFYFFATWKLRST